nr:MAG TPA: hypothetical protein [Caudoviricetes sp.]
MEFKEALDELIDAVTDVEEHGDAIEFLQNYESERSGEIDSEWKDKYMKLESEYKNRFKERMTESATNVGGGEKIVEEEKITVEDLDFNGKTE